MKLYSKIQLVIYSILSALLAFCLALAIILPISLSSKKDQSSLQSRTVSLEENDRDDSANTLFDEELLQTNTPSLSVINNQENYTQDEIQNISVYEKCNEAVVNITTQTMSYDWFLEPILSSSGSGSGSIIDKRGYVITNVHVIENAAKIQISLADGSSYEGRVVGKDIESDIAVLKFDPPENITLKTISFGSSDTLKVGQKVIAIGNPFALERTMTTGIISGLGRPVQESSSVIIRNMIQTDAAINPGNSGGPLLDSQGKMIGINTMIISKSGSSSGIGFAVPVSTARRVVSDLLKYGKVNRGRLNIEYIQNTRSIANYANYPVSTGIIVMKVKASSNAEKAGLKGGTTPVQYRSGWNSTKTIYLGGDLITKIGSIEVNGIADYFSALEDKRPGDSVNITVLRNGKPLVLSIILEDEKGASKSASRT